MTTEKLKKHQKGNKIFSLRYFTGDDKYVITSINSNIVNQVQEAKEEAVFSNKEDALKFWNNKIEN